MMRRFFPPVPADPRRQLLADGIRIAGYLESILSTARELNLPDTLDLATAALFVRMWIRKLEIAIDMEESPTSTRTSPTAFLPWGWSLSMSLSLIPRGTGREPCAPGTLVSTGEIASADPALAVPLLPGRILAVSHASAYTCTMQLSAEVTMGEVLAQDQRDAQIWMEWVSGETQAEIGRRRGIDQSNVSRAISRFITSTPAPDRLAFINRAGGRRERPHRVVEPMALDPP